MSHEANQSELDRRSLLKGAAVGAVGAGLATVPGAPSAAQDRGALKDAAVQTSTVEFESEGHRIQAFLARPRAAARTGAVILIPGIFGMTDYMKESTAQVAQAGLVGLGVEYFSRIGGTPKSTDFAELRQLVGKLTDDNILADLQAGIDYLKKQNLTNGKFGVTGFCMGGRLTLLLAAKSKDIVAACPFYGPVLGSPGRPALMDMTDQIRVPVQGHYGATDMNPRPDDVRAFYEKLKATNPHAEHHIYEGAGHAFHDYSRPSFNATASTAAWSRTLEFFKKHLK